MIMKKRTLFLVLLLLLILILIVSVFISSCGKYLPIESTSDELHVVGTVKDFNIYYDELRCSAMNAQVLMAKEYGIDWNNADDAQKYRDELESRVYEGLLYNYAVQILLNESGYTLDNEDISALVQKELEAYQKKQAKQ